MRTRQLRSLDSHVAAIDEITNAASASTPDASRTGKAARASPQAAEKSAADSPDLGVSRGDNQRPDSARHKFLIRRGGPAFDVATRGGRRDFSPQTFRGNHEDSICKNVAHSKVGGAKQRTHRTMQAALSVCKIPGWVYWSTQSLNRGAEANRANSRQKPRKGAAISPPRYIAESRLVQAATARVRESSALNEDQSGVLKNSVFRTVSRRLLQTMVEDAA